MGASDHRAGGSTYEGGGAGMQPTRDFRWGEESTLWVIIKGDIGSQSKYNCQGSDHRTRNIKQIRYESTHSFLWKRWEIAVLLCMCVCCWRQFFENPKRIPEL